MQGHNFCTYQQNEGKEFMTEQRQSQVFIGTSNIVVPGTKQSFPEAFQQKSRLHFYSSLFNSLEINSSFYKVPMLSTFEKWSCDVPEDFRFTLKIWREISHVKELKIELSNIHHFLKAASGIAQKKGCLLLQFPGKITLEYYSQVESILETLHQQDSPLKWPVAVEFRNPSWHVSESFELLDEYGATMVLHDQPKARNAIFNNRASAVYLRFHGPEGNYRGSYTIDYLEEQAERIIKWKANGKVVYAYFNNTMGSALQNAQSLQQLVGTKILPPRS